MKLKLAALLAALALLLCACSYMVEDRPVQVGERVIRITPEPAR